MTFPGFRFQTYRDTTKKHNLFKCRFFCTGKSWFNLGEIAMDNCGPNKNGTNFVECIESEEFQNFQGFHLWEHLQFLKNYKFEVFMKYFRSTKMKGNLYNIIIVSKYYIY